MTQKNEEEFSILKTYCDQLKKSLTLGQKIKADHLVEVGYHIRICDYIVDKNKDKIILFTTFRYWLECRKHWANNHPYADVERVIPNLELKTKPFYKSEGSENKSMALAIIPKSNKPNKSWEESLTENDKNFLKQLYSGKRPRIPKSDNENEDDGA